MLTKGHNNRILMLNQLTAFEAKRRMAIEEQRMKEQREECARDAQQLFDDMFGG
tara:strand:+ start:63 stop:224 length:162 start_codon:yes stop_codon:yes gene_type:complete